MSDLTPDDMARCRVRLADLPGFGPVGLWCFPSLRAPAEDCDLCVHYDAQSRFPYRLRLPRGEGFVTWPDICVSTIHASTRDRLARWAGGRLKVWPVTSFPPALPATWLRFRFDDYDKTWMLDLCFGTGEHPNHYNVPAWEGFAGGDLRILPDGVRWLEAAALAEIARHLGSRP